MPPRSGGIKKRLATVIAGAPKEEIAAVLDSLWADTALEVKRAPRCGLAMFTLRDPFDTPFHLGEVLVCETEVVLNERIGYGMICGDEPERALLLAAIEAVESGTDRTSLDGLEEIVRRWEALHAAAVERVSKLAASTAVIFDSMKKESVDFGSLGE